MDYTDITLSEWMRCWLDMVEPLYEKTTIAKYEQIVERYIRDYFRDMPLAGADEDVIQQFYDTLGEDGKNLGTQTIHLIANVLHMGLRYACGGGLVPYDASTLAYIRHRTYGGTEVLDEAFIRYILQKKGCNLYDNLYVVMMVCALRFGEAAALSWDDVDLDKRRIRIHRNLVSYYRKGRVRRERKPGTKSHRDRILFIPSFLVPYFEDERNRQEEYRREAGEAFHNPDHLVFTTRLGEYVPHYKVMRRFKKMAQQFGREDACLHTLRHTGASLCYAATNSMLCVRALTGHSAYGAAAYYVHALKGE